jgi:hypothetical protein
MNEACHQCGSSAVRSIVLALLFFNQVISVSFVQLRLGRRIKLAAPAT